MDKASEAILALKPVSFRYKKELDPDGIPQFGLVAEEVEKVNPDLVARDDQGKPYTVRYEAVNAMLLNEFIKARCQIESQQKQIDALTAGLKKVSAQVELKKPAPQMGQHSVRLGDVATALCAVPKDPPPTGRGYNIFQLTVWLPRVRRLP